MARITSVPAGLRLLGFLLLTRVFGVVVVDGVLSVDSDRLELVLLGLG